jgi:hypothetical protein
MAGRRDDAVGVAPERAGGFFEITPPTKHIDSGFFDVFVPTLPAVQKDAAGGLIAFEHGDPQRADYSGSHILYQDITIPTLAIDEYWL